MGKRTPLLYLVLLALVTGGLGSLVAIAATPGTAHACSVAAPYAEVWPSKELRPGQAVEVAGWGFYDISFRPTPAPAPDSGGDRAVPPDLCDFDLTPMADVVVAWHGDSARKLAIVDGPEFVVTVIVPDNARQGWSGIDVGGVWLEVHVGPLGPPPPTPTPPPPPPCPLASEGPATTRPAWPDDCPWPCPTLSDTTAPAPGHLLPCPDPCLDWAHTADNGTRYEWEWDCPHPCDVGQADPGRGAAGTSVACPPDPEPCPPYAAGRVDAEYCPEPCPVYLDGDPAADLWPCPDPCQLVGGDAVWCPPDPCPLYPAATAPTLEHCPKPCADYPALEGSIQPGYCPEPCPVYLDGDPAADLWPCPDPCQLVGGDAIWCPPNPCRLIGGDAISCPEPCQLVGGDAISCPPILPEPIPEPPIPPTTTPPTTTAPAPEAAAVDTVLLPAPATDDQIVTLLSGRMMHRLHSVIAALFGG